MINFDVKLSKSSLSVNEKLSVEFSINKDGNNFSSPDFKNFKVVGGPNQSVKNSWINGVRSYNKTYTYILSPIKGGTYNIGQAKIEALCIECHSDEPMHNFMKNGPAYLEFLKIKKDM